MRKIVVTEFMSLDGIVENPAWTFPYWNDEIAASWPKMSPGKDPFAPYMNSVRKYVASTTLKEPLEWNNSVLLRGNLVEEVNKLKQQGSQDIAVHGSARLAQTLMHHDLVDSLRLLVYPVVVGKGGRLFKEGLPQAGSSWNQRHSAPAW